MVAWICATAPEVLDLLPTRRARALRTRLGLTDDEIATWRDMSRKMLVPFHGEGIISQFEGYERARGPRLGRVPRALRRQGSQRLDRMAGPR